ncbi:MAG: S9 family peptidase, partial [Pyrinomonadaceae bacterium]|nr:S9 family peptidase [Pyrinomonadaceae bacterium]
MKPPVAKRERKVTKIHGRELIDEYHWLRDRSEEKSKEIIEYLKAENDYTEAVMKPREGLTETIYDEIVGRIKQTDESVPYKKGDYWYYSKTFEGKQYPVYYRASSFEKENSEVLIDQNELAGDHEFYAISAFRVSDDGNLLAFSDDTTGYRQYTLRIKDLRSGEFLATEIERVVSVVWATNSRHIFYVQEEEVTKRNDTFWRYDLETDESELIRKEDDVLFNMWASRSRDKKFIYLNTSAATMDEYRFISADKPESDWSLVLPREEGHEYSVDNYNGRFYITTNRDAENFRIVMTDVDAPSEGWKDFVAHDPSIKIEGIDFFEGFGVVSEVEKGLEYLRVIDMESGDSDRIDTPESVYSMGISGGNAEFQTSKVRYSYSSMITPESVFEYDMKTAETKLLKQQEILGGYYKTNYETKRVWAEARDGVKVPVSIVMKKGTKLDGSA